ncbi:MAG: NUDIX hydrolase [Burkholderiaceae bacterium]
MSLRRRPAARLLVTDPFGRVLLFRFEHRHGALAGIRYWATPGGGLEPGETFAQAAVRELREETGIVLADAGPVIARRQLVLQISSGEHVLEEEQYFHIAASSDFISLDGWTASERESMMAFRWWTHAELEATHEQVSPDNLLEILLGQTA